MALTVLTTVAIGAGLPLTPAGAVVAPRAMESRASTSPAGTAAAAAAGRDSLVTVDSSTLPEGIAELHVKPGYANKANSCIQLWMPYGQKIKGKWYVVAGGRLNDCGLTFFVVTLQQKRAWGWDDRDSKTITRKGDFNPKAKCKTFGTYSWRTTGYWYRYTDLGKTETLGYLTTKSQRMKC